MTATPKMVFFYDPFPHSDIGYSSRTRWGFFTDGDLPGHTGTTDPVPITEPVRHALTTEQWLILEIDARQGSQRTDPPLIYRYRAVFNLTERREAVADVIDQCGTAPPDPDKPHLD